MGHADIKTTANVYAQGVDEKAAAVVNGYYDEIVRAGRSKPVIETAKEYRVQ